MNKLAVSLSALFLTLGLLSGCGSDDKAAKETAEKTAEAPKEAAPAAEASKEAAAPAEAAKTPAEQAVEKAATEAAATPAATEQAAAPAATEQAAAPAATEQAAAPAATEQAAAPAATEQAAAPAVQAGIDGEKIYRGLCFSCHDMGVANAPKPGDKAAWEPRIAAGMDAIYASTINGKGAMPAKGGNPALSDDEVKAATDWMIAQSK